jgi:hypothetical protein
MVDGEKPDPHCQFYEQSKLDVDASKAAGRRIYSTVLMVKYTQPGVTDWAPQRAQRADIEQNQDAYNYFLTTKADVGSPSITILPGIRPDECQELIDYGILTITKLCQANTLPKHLQHLQASARRLNEVLKYERKNNEEVHTKEAGAIQAEVVPAPDRQVNAVDERRCDVPGGLIPQVGTIADGSREGGRLNGGEGRTGSQDEDHQAGREKSEEVARWDNPNWSLSIG